ncbi:MAG: membrane protein insertion efficiency factor YidD [Bacteroidota bacterium]
MNLGPPRSPLYRAALAVWRLPRLLLIAVVRFYQVAISPLFPPSCRYTPTCSQYAILALRQYGFVRGTILAVWRMLRCAPWGGHGHDPPRWFGEPKAPEPVTASGQVPDPSGPASDSPRSTGALSERPPARPAPPPGS